MSPVKYNYVYCRLPRIGLPFMFLRPQEIGYLLMEINIGPVPRGFCWTAPTLYADYNMDNISPYHQIQNCTRFFEPLHFLFYNTLVLLFHIDNSNINLFFNEFCKQLCNQLKKRKVQ